MPIYLWSDQEIFVERTRGPRTLRGYWWLSDYYSIKKNDIAARWSCSGKAGASLLGQDVVASLLSLCMAKWLRKWRRGWLYVRSNTKNDKSLLSLEILYFFKLKKKVCGVTELSGPNMTTVLTSPNPTQFDRILEFGWYKWNSSEHSIAESREKLWQHFLKNDSLSWSH